MNLYLSSWPPINLSIYLSIYPSIYLPTVSINISIYLYQSIYQSINQSLDRSIYMGMGWNLWSILVVWTSILRTILGFHWVAGFWPIAISRNSYPQGLGGGEFWALDVAALQPGHWVYRGDFHGKSQLKTGFKTWHMDDIGWFCVKPYSTKDIFTKRGFWMVKMRIWNCKNTKMQGI